MPEPTDFWEAAPADPEIDLPPLTDAVLAAFERRTGLRLPAELVALLRQRNGGRLACPEFRLAKDEVITCDELMGIGGTESWNAISTLAGFLAGRGEDVADWRGVVADPARVLLLAGDGHWFYALDYGAAHSTRAPAVVHLELECGPRRRVVAPSFPAFLGMAYAGDAGPAIDWETPPGPLLAEDRVDSVSRHDRSLRWIAHCRCYRRGRALVVRCERRQWDSARELVEGVIASGTVEVDGFGGMLGGNADPPFTTLNISSPGGMVRVTTCRQVAGRWKNQTDELAYVPYDCPDQARADAVAALIGAAPPDAEALAQRDLLQRAMAAQNDPAKLAALQQEMMAKVMGDLQQNLGELDAELAKLNATPKPRRRKG